MFIAKVIHQANIDVDEKGTEAAAATAVVGDTTGGCGPASRRSSTRTLRLDQPFMYLIRDVADRRDPVHGPRPRSRPSADAAGAARAVIARVGPSHAFHVSSALPAVTSSP